MDPLDNDYGIVDPSTVSPRPVGQYYGLIGGLALVAFGLVTYLFDMVDYSGQSGNWGINLLNWAIMGGAIFMAIKTHKERDLGGYITFGRSFATGMWTSLFIALLVAVWSFLLFTVVDPSLAETIQSLSIEQMEEQGLSEEEMEASMGFVSMFTSPTAITLMGFFGTLLWGLILSLIVGAILKKDPPMA